jgi:hypothetical protein
MKKDELEVHGKNELKKVALFEITNILLQLPQYLTKRIDTQAGLSKKFVVNLSKPKPEPLKDGYGMTTSCYLSISYGELVLHTKICLNGGSYEDRTNYCQYFNRTFVIGKVENFCLTEIYTLDSIVKDYGLDVLINLEAELLKIARYNELEAELRELRFKIQIEM